RKLAVFLGELDEFARTHRIGHQGRQLGVARHQPVELCVEGGILAHDQLRKAASRSFKPASGVSVWLSPSRSRIAAKPRFNSSSPRITAARAFTLLARRNRFLRLPE